MPDGTPTEGSEWRLEVWGRMGGISKLKTKNSKLSQGRHSEFRIPNSEFAYVGFARRENTTTKTHSAIKVTVPMISPGIPSKA